MINLIWICNLDPSGSSCTIYHPYTVPSNPRKLKLVKILIARHETLCFSSLSEPLPSCLLAYRSISWSSDMYIQRDWKSSLRIIMTIISVSTQNARWWVFDSKILCVFPIHQNSLNGLHFWVYVSSANRSECRKSLIVNKRYRQRSVCRYSLMYCMWIMWQDGFTQCLKYSWLSSFSNLRSLGMVIWPSFHFELTWIWLVLSTTVVVHTSRS